MYISGNVGSGSPQEMADWMEYMTSDTVSTLANERRKNGRDKPWDVHYFGIGNETWGCGGNMRPEYYADLFRQYATYVKAPRGQRPEDRRERRQRRATRTWTDVLTHERASRHGRDLASLLHHAHRRVGEEGQRRSASPKPNGSRRCKHTMQIDEYITDNVKILDKHDPQRTRRVLRR